MKGQFMMLSAVIAGFITISAASTITEVSENEFETDSTTSNLYLMKDEAKEFDLGKKSGRESFENMVDSWPGFDARVSLWNHKNCINLTVSFSGGQNTYSCLNND